MNEKRKAVRAVKKQSNDTLADQVIRALASLERLSSKSTRDGLARFGLPADNALGVPVGDIRKLAKQLGRNHALAEELWNTGIFEARMLACFIDDPSAVTPAQMDRWAKDFDGWGICDTACFHLFDRTPHAWRKIKQWSGRKDEFVKRAAFALLASLALHNKKAPDEPFSELLPFIEKAADDDRNFVKKGVSWALRSIGHRSHALHAEAVAMAKRLSTSPHATNRWIGKDALKDLTRPKVLRRLAMK